MKTMILNIFLLFLALTEGYQGWHITSSNVLEYNGGYVCRDNFYQDEAEAVCRFMGMTFSDYQRGYYTGINAHYTIDDLNCPSSATTLSDCSYTNNDDCGEWDGVKLWCIATTTAEPVASSCGSQTWNGFDVDHAYDIGGVIYASYHECFERCEDHPDCLAFSFPQAWTGSSDQCILKSYWPSSASDLVESWNRKIIALTCKLNPPTTTTTSSTSTTLNPTVAPTISEACLLHPCAHGEVEAGCALEITGELKCVCQSGYYYDEEFGCMELNACDSNPCLNDGICEDLEAPNGGGADGRICHCPDGIYTSDCSVQQSPTIAPSTYDHYNPSNYFPRKNMLCQERSTTVAMSGNVPLYSTLEVCQSICDNDDSCFGCMFDPNQFLDAHYMLFTECWVRASGTDKVIYYKFDWNPSNYVPVENAYCDERRLDFPRDSTLEECQSRCDNDDSCFGCTWNFQSWFDAPYKMFTECTELYSGAPPMIYYKPDATPTIAPSTYDPPSSSTTTSPTSTPKGFHLTSSNELMFNDDYVCLPSRRGFRTYEADAVCRFMGYYASGEITEGVYLGSSATYSMAELVCPSFPIAETPDECSWLTTSEDCGTSDGIRVTCVDAPTSIPTQSPVTSIPTTSPSSIPSNAPTTSAPTRNPTTSAPTGNPTTSAPTENPTASPSRSPSFSPVTSAPSHGPTNFPTVTPTNMPSQLPTVQPSNLPTVHPTTMPSDVPSSSPSIAPSRRPTVNPTHQPTVDPTIAPSVVPTIAPSVVPTIAPSVVPTIAPSVVPTTTPTFVPTFNPTDFYTGENEFIVQYSATFLGVEDCGMFVTGLRESTAHAFAISTSQVKVESTDCDSSLRRRLAVDSSTSPVSFTVVITSYGSEADAAELNELISSSELQTRVDENLRNRGFDVTRTQTTEPEFAFTHSTEENGNFTMIIIACVGVAFALCGLVVLKKRCAAEKQDIDSDTKRMPPFEDKIDVVSAIKRSISGSEHLKIME